MTYYSHGFSQFLLNNEKTKSTIFIGTP